MMEGSIATARLAQSVERKALILVVVGSSPTVGALVRTGEQSVCLRETLGWVHQGELGEKWCSPKNMSIHCIQRINLMHARMCGQSLSI